jgi:hypothetical protein
MWSNKIRVDVIFEEFCKSKRYSKIIWVFKTLKKRWHLIKNILQRYCAKDDSNQSNN